jgi:ribonucleoside-diphosphate reductase alpha chain
MESLTIEVPLSFSDTGRNVATAETESIESKTFMDGTHAPERLTRVFSQENVHPFDEVTWNRRDIDITDDKGKVIFTQASVEAPEFWSNLAVKIVASKYFWGERGSSQRENSIRKLIHRVCDTIATWAVEDGYVHPGDEKVFYDELCWLCLRQYVAFNSPVWFNVGLYHQYEAGKNNEGGWVWDADLNEAVRSPTQYENPQTSACFIVSVDDNMDSLMDLAKIEAMLFKYGSGTGTDLTPIRSFREKLSGGGTPSGPMSFLKVYDQVANVVKSGGKTRRAAKMNILRDWHPDIEEFIMAKVTEEKKAWALIEQGYSGDFNGDAYGSVMYQNENLSVRVSDEFMKSATTGDGTWWTKAVTTHEKISKKDAKELLTKMAEAAWLCGDPGVQFDGSIQRYNTCAGTEPINATNPCSEYVFLNNTACNLASLNLMRFDEKDGFNTDRFRAAIRLVFLAQEVLIDNSSYPTKVIAENAHIFRTVGLGYANLGALLMSYGTPYDSDLGRNIAASITAIMTGEAYLASSQVSKVLGPFPGYHDARCAHVAHPLKVNNMDSMRDVLQLHSAQVAKLRPSPGFSYLDSVAKQVWRLAIDSFNHYGVRNSQATVLAPTGTIAFMMDCDTTGIEPEIGLVKHKTLAGGGDLTIVNQTIYKALKRLGYEEPEIVAIVDHVKKYGHVEDHIVDEGGIKVNQSPCCVKPGHRDIFDCSLPAGPNKRSIPYKAHIQMMAAVQPFISGAISKTVNMPTDSTIDDVRSVYVEAWELGLKCVAIYRDGSKRSQPLNVKKIDGKPGFNGDGHVEAAHMARHRLPDTRKSVTHKFNVAGHEGYLTVGLFEDHSPGELFITMAKEGSTVGGLMDTIGTLTSLSLQYGVPLDVMTRKFLHSRFEPSGFTGNPKIRQASSLVDYIYHWLALEFGVKPNGDDNTTETCPQCGHVAQRSGTCHTCPNCGTSIGCS